MNTNNTSNTILIKGDDVVDLLNKFFNWHIDFLKENDLIKIRVYNRFYSLSKAKISEFKIITEYLHNILNAAKEKYSIPKNPITDFLLSNDYNSISIYTKIYNKNYVGRDYTFFLNHVGEINIGLVDFTYEYTIKSCVRIIKNDNPILLSICNNHYDEVKKLLDEIEENWYSGHYDICSQKCLTLYELLCKIFTGNDKVDKRVDILEIFKKGNLFKDSKMLGTFTNFYKLISYIRNVLKNNIDNSKDSLDTIELRNEYKDLSSLDKRMLVRLFIDYCMTLFNLILISNSAENI